MVTALDRYCGSVMVLPVILSFAIWSSLVHPPTRSLSGSMLVRLTYKICGWRVTTVVYTLMVAIPRLNIVWSPITQVMELSWMQLPSAAWQLWIIQLPAMEVPELSIILLPRLRYATQSCLPIPVVQIVVQSLLLIPMWRVPDWWPMVISIPIPCLWMRLMEIMSYNCSVPALIQVIPPIPLIRTVP